ncbi:Z1 domain-containing protein [Corynebacterium sp. CCM 8835]|uniref:Z1 domain-containing protein n=1 Tax=Corynebacterium antarcticum TaxID=2800405 RepID=A0ABS1FMX1_9CORY|nr:Z1 domain-containing protein [Corynebacterium antarcticum]MCL0246207.1 Z1 domain-containing protein [Corynebacterium antarcticum]MCX7492458.1 Z1 domain-containing protein [Corynebacterium antarcticum]MCX7540798.1 Z1 domain-containing protein [Corynebacterium antarcticum]
MKSDLDQGTLAEIEEMIRDWKALGRSLEWIENKLRQPPFSLIDESHRSQALINYRIKNSFSAEPYIRDTSFRDRRITSEGIWYSPEACGDTYWAPVRELIRQDIGDEALEEVDRSSTAIINSIDCPRGEKVDSRGLVVGYVQSGKTTNFLSVIAKAADAGYRFIIVLSGMTDALREQTQQRFEEKLLAPNGDKWRRMTHPNCDFGASKDDEYQNAAFDLSQPDGRYIAVVKKNGHVLKRLNRFLRSGGVHTAQCPILVIDDESDQASINVSKQQKAEISTINGQIRSLLENKKVAYIAYTATPFANILVNPNDVEDIYPRDFITVLNKPKGYFGAEDLFGREALSHENYEENDGKDMIRIIPDEEAKSLKPPTRQKDRDAGPWSPEVPESLTDAIRWFIMASAARRFRGQAHKHSSMLIHTAMRTEEHEITAALVEDEIRGLRAELAGHSPVDDWRSQWEQECARVPSSDYPDLSTVSFADIAPLIPEVLGDTKVVIDNSRSDRRLEYGDDRPETVIAIGGNTLARGLTLEGLLSSYFLRNASAYDTLLQMGRWFGFRNGYQDLPRVWLTSELAGWFRDLALVEADLRMEMQRYVEEGITPLEFQARIRVHPSLEVTSRAKAQNMRKAKVSYSGSKPQSILFKHRDHEWLSNNIEAARNLVSSISDGGPVLLGDGPLSNGSYVYRSVDTDDIIAFLRSYRFHEKSTLGKDANGKLIDYILEEAAEGSITSWNVSFFGRGKTGETGTIDLGLPGELQMISRARMRDGNPEYANIKSLTSPFDRINDATADSEVRETLIKSSREKGTSRERRLLEIHDDHAGMGTGHLAIYAIDRNSVPQRSSEKGNMVREPLRAVDDLIGVCVFFPESSRTNSAVDYVCTVAPEDEVLAAYQTQEEELRAETERQSEDEL